jgi:CBS domain-containing protein
VTKGDLIQRGESGPSHTSRWLRLFGESTDSAVHYIKTHGKSAADVITCNVLTVDEETPVGDIARIMAERHVKRVPVVSDGELVGIVSRSNLLRAIVTREGGGTPTSDDRSIKDTILKQVGEQGWVSHGTLNVIATGGVASCGAGLSRRRNAGRLSFWRRALPAFRGSRTILGPSRTIWNPPDLKRNVINRNPPWGFRLRCEFPNSQKLQRISDDLP